MNSVIVNNSFRWTDGLNIGGRFIFQLNTSIVAYRSRSPLLHVEPGIYRKSTLNLMHGSSMLEPSTYDDRHSSTAYKWASSKPWLFPCKPMDDSAVYWVSLSDLQDHAVELTPPKYFRKISHRVIAGLQANKDALQAMAVVWLENWIYKKATCLEWNTDTSTVGPVAYSNFKRYLIDLGYEYDLLVGHDMAKFNNFVDRCMHIARTELGL